MCAVIQRGILGGFRNKIGNVVGTSWKGIAVMKSLPLSVANPQTAGQTLQRGRFSQTSKFASTILSTVVKPLWDRFAQRESGFNAFLQTNIDFFTESGVSEPNNILISKGTLAPANLISAVIDESASTIALTWDATPLGDANPSDTLFVVVNNTGTSATEGFNTGVARSVGTATLDLTLDEEVGNVNNVWVAFRKADGTKVSNTEYTSVTATA